MLISLFGSRSTLLFLDVSNWEERCLICSYGLELLLSLWLFAWRSMLFFLMYQIGGAMFMFVRFRNIIGYFVFF